MVKRSENITHRLFNRQLSCKPSGSQLHTVRTLYENIVPSHTVYDVECPDHTFRKFTNDGQYLIAFTRSFQHLVVYRFNWLNFCVKGEAEDAELPPKAAKFESFFTELYCVALATGTETICKDFFLTTENGVYGLFATSTGPDADAASVQGAVPGVPSIEKIRILAVRLADGIITDDRIYHDDFIHLSHNMGVFMYEDLLAILSVRFQCVHILQIRDSGTFVDVRSVGDFCQEDDELLVSSQTQVTFPRSLSESNARSGREQSNSSSETGPPVLGGIKQRLLSFIFRSILEHDDDHVQRAQRLKRFYYHFQHYTELVMWKVQFLDRYHLLIKFGSADGVISRSCDVSQQLAFFVVYNFETTEILEFQQNSSLELLQLFENFADHFRSAQRYPVYMNYVTSFSNNVFVREQSREQKVACINTKASNKANSFAPIARRTLASLPVNSQSQSPSVYFDHSLFHFDEKLISATDRHKPSMEHPIKFLSRRRPHILKFKINPGPENGANETRIKRVAAFVFHPIFPFAISIQQSFLQASVVNFHFRK
ncbi:hypothetical protein SELMODRAFT_104399 [Selaginella moellendorffii]|uniref:Uncharacterized protein DET1-2 n=1 Tax=Selaginella moellendorffii TaxID=88036 RepID=D8RYJ5_SELML|nr:hypothetical protein SELMODRAFT_104399 [Selaginella moellendorffii]